MDNVISEHMNYIVSIIIVILMVVLWHSITVVYYKYINTLVKAKKRSENNSMLHLAFNIARIIVATAGIFGILVVNKIDISTTIASMGLVSVIVGLALQDTMRDIIRGLSLMSDKFVSLGDVVEYEGVCGEVIALSLRSIKLRDISNGNIITMFYGNINSIVKLSGVQNINIPLPYDIDYMRAREAMARAADEIEKINGIILCSYKGVQEFASSAVLHRIKITTKQIERDEMRRMTLMKVQEVLAEEGIKIPYNQLDVHLNNIV